MPARQPGTVLTVGRIYADLIFSGLGAMPELGREVYADGVVLCPGGGAFITASVMASLGHPVCISTRLPGHPLNIGLIPEILSSGIDIAGIERGEPDEPQMTVVMVGDEDRAFLTRRIGPSAPPSFFALMRRDDIAHVHVAELATLADAPQIVAETKLAGRTISVDCAWDEELFRRKDLLDLLEGVDLFLPNEAEAMRLSGTMELTPRALAPLRERVGVLAVKRGPNGGWAFRDGESVAVAADRQRPVDTTGAGDSFNAGFIVPWLNERPLADCLASAVATGSAAVAVAGGGDIRPDLAVIAEQAAALPRGDPERDMAKTASH